MIGEKFEFNGKEYSIKKDLSFGEYKKISKLGNNLQKLGNDFKTAKDEEKQKIIDEFSKTTDEQIDMIGAFLESILGLKQEDIDNLSLLNAVELFNRTFTISTEVKKKSEITLESPSSQTTQETQS